MFTYINANIRRILFFIALVIVYTLLPHTVKELVGSFAVGWVTYDLAKYWFPGD